MNYQTQLERLERAHRRGRCVIERFRHIAGVHIVEKRYTAPDGEVLAVDITIRGDL